MYVGEIKDILLRIYYTQVSLYSCFREHFTSTLHNLPTYRLASYVVGCSSYIVQIAKACGGNIRNFRWRQWGSLLQGLRTLDPLLSPP